MQHQQDINLYWISFERGLPETQAKYVVHDKQEALKFDLKIYIYQNQVYSSNIIKVNNASTLVQKLKLNYWAFNCQ